MKRKIEKENKNKKEKLKKVTKGRFKKENKK